jgi:hypothetical protein
MILIAALLFATIPVAGAQPDERERGQRLCRNDATRLCRKVLDQGDFAVLACFQQNQQRLSKRCRDFLREMGQL